MYVRSAVSSPYILTHFVGIGIHAFLDLKMKLSWSRCVFISVLIAAGFLYLADVAEGANEFRRCYNTSVEMHCFDLQYDTTNNRWLTASFDNARQRCNNLNSTLPIIKDEVTNNFVQSYISDPYNPIRDNYVWTDAYRINDYNNSYTWHWLDSKLPNLAAPEVVYNVFIWDSRHYTTTLECRNDSGKPQFYLTAKQPQNTNSYLCEYSVSRCPSSGSVFQFSDKCYLPFSAQVSWYEARNKCFKDGGDLASFANVTSINFTSWLGSDTNVRFWIGLRFSWYIWKESGEEVKFSKWTENSFDWNSPCLMVCSNCNPKYSWFAKDCNTWDSIYVVCHTVTPLPTTTLTTPSTTTLPVTTSVDIKTQTETTQSYNPRVEKSSPTGSPPIGVAVGVGVGVGVPVIVAIIVIAICVVRKHKSKTQGSTTTRQESRDETSHTEYQNNSGYSEDSEVNHYAIVHPSSPPKMVEQEPSSEPQYAILGFSESADRKSDIGHFPLNVL